MCNVNIVGGLCLHNDMFPSLLRVDVRASAVYVKGPPSCEEFYHKKVYIQMELPLTDSSHALSRSSPPASSLSLTLFECVRKKKQLC